LTSHTYAEAEMTSAEKHCE